MTREEALSKMRAIGQEHVLAYYDELDEDARRELLTQIEETDFDVLRALSSNKSGLKRGTFEPLRAMQLYEINKRQDELYNKGCDIIRDGKTCALLLAGGMGTRLGFDNPKGMYDIGITKPVYIFQRIVENLLDVVNETDTWIRLFVMTSEKNHEATVAFFKEKDYFGYKEDYVVFFKQDMAPACDYNGKLYMESKSRIFTSPNGNAGWYSSMVRAGLGKILTDEGIEWINVFAVDNVLQRICDPTFIGAVTSAGVSVGAKVVRKAARDEKVGVICLEDGRPSIVEYYELSDEMMDAKGEDGEPLYNFGVILNYLFCAADLEEVKDNAMPTHVVEKKIAHIDDEGNLVEPLEPNGYKFEQLVLDMIAELKSCLPYEVVREQEFAPIKNKTGIDSVESARKLCIDNGIRL